MFAELVIAELVGDALDLNEFAETRAGLLDSLFPVVTVKRFEAAQIEDQLKAF